MSNLYLRHILSEIKTLLYRKPRDEFFRLCRWGPRAYFRTDSWKRQMEEAAYKLPVFDPCLSSLPPLEVWFLTGNRFWYQTVFCAWSLSRCSQRNLTVHLVDDGTLTFELENAVRRLFPAGQTHWRKSCREKLEKLLPASQYPILNERWHDYINIHKLIAPHLGTTGSKLILDSDMLFFDKPNELLNWHNSQLQPCLMSDCYESYGYSRELMEQLAGVPILPCLNVGICGLDSSLIDWDEIEFWCRTFLEKEGTSYFLEQAVFAMLASRYNPFVLPRSKYITFPSRHQISNAQGVLHHYVADSKPGYFRQAWRLVL